MKFKKKLITLLICLLGSLAFSQSRLEISPYAGMSYPTFLFNQFSKTGYSAGINTDFYFSPKWGIGLDFNHHSTDFINPIDFSLIPESSTAEYSVNTSILSKWRATTFAFGPTLKIGSSKFNFDIFTKVGLTFINKPIVESSFIYNGQEKDLLSFVTPGDETMISSITGIRLNVRMGERTDFFICPQFAFYGKKINYEFVDLSDTYYTDPNGIETFDPNILIEQPSKSNAFNISQLGISVGVKIKLGSNSKVTATVSENNQPESSDCLLQLFEDTIYCQVPNIDTISGNLLYSGKVKILNAGTKSLELRPYGTIQQILDIDAGTVTVTGITYSIGSNCTPLATSSFPIQLSPNQEVWVCFDAAVPASAASVNISARGLDYISDNCIDIGETLIELPNCICPSCDEMGATITHNPADLNLMQINIPSQDINYIRGTLFTDLSTTVPVKKIKTEIIYFDQLSNNEDCRICNKAPDYQVHFYNQNATSTGLNTIMSGLAYHDLNNGNRDGMLFAPNGKFYSNEVNWIANSPTTGADISSGLRLKLDLSFPQIRQLSCCTEEVKICIRIKLTDINNTICEKVICYSGDFVLPSSTGNGNSGTSSGTNTGNN